MKRLVAMFFLVPICLHAEVRYTVVPLVPTAPNYGNGGAVAINSLGVSVGSYFNASYTGSTAFRYGPGGFEDLGATSGGITYVSGINDDGQISAYGSVLGGSGSHAFRYTPGVGFADLGNFSGRAAETSGINSAGLIAGTYELNDGTEHAYRLSDASGMQDLGVLSGQNSAAHGINDLGWVTGTSANRAFIYSDALGMVDIGSGSGWAINNAGVVAGEALRQPVVYMDGEVIPLGGIGSARGINNNNVIVGGADSGSFQYAFVWSQDEGMEDLNSLIDPNSGWYLATAVGINDAGQIVGGGFYPERGTVWTGFRLDPIPEPSTWALLGLGCALAFVFCRNRQR